MTLDAMHWRALKKMVEARGGLFQNKEQAIAFLSALDASVATEPVDIAGDAMLDRSLPFGTISGDLEDFPTARYVQFGRMFDGTGKQVG